MGQEAFPPLPQAAPAPRPPPPAGLQARPFINPLAAKAPAKGKGNAASKAPSQVRSLSFIKRHFIMIHRLPYVLLFAGDMVKIKRLINLFEVFCCPCTCCGTLLTYKALAEGRQPVSQSVSSQHKNALKHRRHFAPRRLRLPDSLSRHAWPPETPGDHIGPAAASIQQVTVSLLATLPNKGASRILSIAQRCILVAEFQHMQSLHVVFLSYALARRNPIQCPYAAGNAQAGGLPSAWWAGSGNHSWPLHQSRPIRTTLHLRCCCCPQWWPCSHRRV